MHDADAVFRAVSDPTRREMLLMLREREFSVGELAEPFAMTQPAVSQHLRVLREAGLVTTRRDGRNRIYRIEPEALRTIVDWLEHYRGFWADQLWRLGQHLEEGE